MKVGTRHLHILLSVILTLEHREQSAMRTAYILCVFQDFLPLLSKIAIMAQKLATLGCNEQNLAFFMQLTWKTSSSDINFGNNIVFLSSQIEIKSFFIILPPFFGDKLKSRTSIPEKITKKIKGKSPGVPCHRIKESLHNTAN